MSAPIGAHVSIAGGVSRAIGRGARLGCEAIQIFVKNASQWRGKPLESSEIELFRKAHADSEIGPLVAHASYLINLCANDPGNLEKSRAALKDELERCHQLRVPGLVVHPGAHLGAGLDRGLELVAGSLREVLSALPDNDTKVLLENTAGQGSLVGYRLEHLARILHHLDSTDRVGICIDTCHAFAAGYDLNDSGGYRGFLDEMTELFGPRGAGCVHLNDSRHGLGAKRDRHANLGQGEISLTVFERLLYEPSFESVPMILETPMGDDSEGHRRDLELLRSL